MNNLKSFLLIVTLIFFSEKSFAQCCGGGLDVFDTATTLGDVLYIMDSFATNSVDTGEGGAMVQYGRMKAFWTKRVTSNDTSANDSTNKNMFTQYFSALNNAMVSAQSAGCGTSGFHGNWECLGPLELPLQQMGRVDVVWADKSPNNLGHILVGGMGGLFETTNTGATWECLTDNTILSAGIFGVSSICVDPTNNNNIFLGTSGIVPADQYGNNAHGNHWLVGGAGIIKSNDGGQTWTQETLNNNPHAFDNEIARIQKVYITPDGARLYAFEGPRIWTRSMSGSTWTDITPPNSSLSGINFGNDYDYLDLDFVPGNQNHFYVAGRYYNSSTKRQTGVIWESQAAVPTANDWSEITVGTNNISFTVTSITNVTFTHSDIQRYELDIPDANTLYVLALPYSKTPYTAHNSTTVLTYNITGTPKQWSYRGTINSYPAIANEYKLTFDVSDVQNSFHNNNRLIYIGTTVPYVSSDNGQTFTQIGNYHPTLTANSHADVRELVIQSATNTENGEDDIVIIVTDGGVSRKGPGVDPDISGIATMQDISGYGLSVGHYWGFDMSEFGGLGFGGAMHHGKASYEPTQSPKWLAITNEDAYTTVFDRGDRTVAYGVDGYGLNKGRDYTIPGSGRAIVSDNTSGFPSDANENLQLSQDVEDDNDHYIGIQDLWRSSVTNPSSVTWASQANLGLTVYPHTDGKGIRSLDFSDYKDYHGYVLYEHSLDGQNKQDLFYRDPSILNGVFLNKMLNTPIGGQCPMTDITLDPWTPERVWASLGGFNHDPYSTQAHNRVWYSENAGTSWYDVSFGLPNGMPITDIIYQEGANMVYCATDVGIYRADFNNFNSGNSPNYDIEWECFRDQKISGKYFPNGYVTELGINYCSGKLFASTMGRSIWVSDLFESGDIPNSTEIITTNTTWNDTKYIRAGIRVKSGATLTINNSTTTIYMPKNGAIIIEPNGKLIVNDATITNVCEDCMWEGIHVVGDPALLQSVINQGSLELNGATIEHAKNAIANYDVTGLPHNSTGGIISAENTTFLNNRFSVNLDKYVYKKSWNSPSSRFYKATFTKCTFIVDDEFKGGTENEFVTHVLNREVSGAIYEGCEFYNRHTLNDYRGLGDGIRSLNSTIRVRAYCDNSTNPCTYTRSKFTGFRNGIVMQDAPFGALSEPVISRADFDSCGVGIYGMSQGMFIAEHNTFNVGTGRTVNLDPLVDCYKNIGIWTEGRTIPIIEHNDFDGVTFTGQHVNHQNLGVVSDNTGYDNKTIYHNDFNDLTVACLARGVNSDDGRYSVAYDHRATGLLYECNAFDDNEHDVVIRSLDVNLHHNVKRYQGYPFKSAGNQFYDVNSDNHFYHTGTKYNVNVYFHSGSTTEPNVNPTYPTLATRQILDANSCADDIHLGGTTPINTFPPLNPTDIANADLKFHAFDDTMRDLEATLETYIDGGSTQDLLDEIAAATYADTPVLKSNLSSIAPYVSEEAITALGDADLLSKTTFIKVIEENPEVIFDRDLKNHIQYNIPNPLTATEISDLVDYAYANLSDRTDLSSEIAYHNKMRSAYGNLIISHYLLDTTASDIDSIPVWLDTIGTLEAAYAKVKHYMGLGDLTTAESVMNSIPTNFTLSQEQDDEHTLYESLFAIVDAVLDDGRTIAQLTSTEQSSIDNIYNDPGATGREIGRQIDVMNNPPTKPMYVPCDYDPVPIPHEKKGRAIANTRRSLKELETLSKNRLLKVYPNPAKDHVTFEYDVRGRNNVILIVTNTTGQKIKEVPLDSQRNKIEWDTGLTPSGVYLYELKENNNTIDIGKIVITK